ncbi:hypothetical protein [Methylococcus sp. EFPC2]|uniref:hypothetical protein n=1 Tax=Methylococcus sp. EFPC2 TaxID=2812648 RepID=UPI0019676002|nr:hypothetical protein [Methylococcus sp. EFPC2]QSA96849.1 hypothetical protein JWZ97_16840 [Methylococcus sp. EFPC2]
MTPRTKSPRATLFGGLLFGTLLALGGCAATPEAPAPTVQAPKAASALSCPSNQCLHGVKVNNQCTYYCGTCPATPCN